MSLLQNIRVLEIRDERDLVREMEKVRVHPEGISRMAPKGLHYTIKLEGIEVRAALILKQEMLAAGGDVALPQEVIQLNTEKADVILLGSKRQFEVLLEKLKHQPFHLPLLRSEIERVLQNFNSHPIELRCGKYTLSLSSRTHVMGILNVTPNSFSNGGKFNEVRRAVARAKEMVEEGADIVDVGGESTRPGSEPVSVDEELRRVVPVVRELTKELNVPISVDTRKSEVALECLKCGAHLINDVSGLNFDPKLASVIAEFGVPVVLMHMKGTPKDMQLHAEYDELISEIILQLKRSIEFALDEGIEQIIIDPGIGFGKKTSHNLELLRKLREFKSLGYPILVGTSRKSLIGDVLKLPVGERLEGTAATVAVSIMNGANIIRVHDVREMVRVARMVDAVIKNRRDE